MNTKSFEEDLKRDLVLVSAGLRGGLEGLRAAAMLMPEFSKGPDIVDAYTKWLAEPSRREYRQQIAHILLTDS